MKIAIVGAGAMGSLFGALFAESGREVWLCDIRPECVSAITKNGLQIDWEGKTRVVRINITLDPDQIGPADLVIVFVKSPQTAPAAETAARIAGAGGLVMTLQNGMGNADIIAETIDPARILAGTTSHGATVLGHGKIRHAGKGPTIIGTWAVGTEGNQAEKIAQLHNLSYKRIAKITTANAERLFHWQKSG